MKTYNIFDTVWKPIAEKLTFEQARKTVTQKFGECRLVELKGYNYVIYDSEGNRLGIILGYNNG